MRNGPSRCPVCPSVLVDSCLCFLPSIVLISLYHCCLLAHSPCCHFCDVVCRPYSVILSSPQKVAGIREEYGIFLVLIIVSAQRLNTSSFLAHLALDSQEQFLRLC